MGAPNVFGQPQDFLQADEGAGSSRGIRTEALKGALEEAGVEIKHKALLFSGPELSEAEDAVQQGMDLAKGSASRSPGTWKSLRSAWEVGIEGQIALRQETENLVPSEINTGLDAVSRLAQFSTSEIDDPSHAAFSQQETGLNHKPNKQEIQVKTPPLLFSWHRRGYPGMKR